MLGKPTNQKLKTSRTPLVKNKLSSENIAKSKAGQEARLRKSKMVSGAAKKAHAQMKATSSKSKKEEILKAWKKQSRKR